MLRRWNSQSDKLLSHTLHAYTFTCSDVHYGACRPVTDFQKLLHGSTAPLPLFNTVACMLIRALQVGNATLSLPS